MRLLAWLALVPGGILLLAEVLTLVRGALRIEAAPPRQVSGAIWAVALLVLFYLAKVFGVGRVLLWVWVAAGGLLLVVLGIGLLRRART